MVLYLVTLTDL